MIEGAGLPVFATVIRALTKYTKFDRPTLAVLDDHTAVWRELEAVLSPPIDLTTQTDVSREDVNA